MTRDERDDFDMAVEDAYDKVLQKTEGRGISWGECAFIQCMTDEQARSFLEECYNKLNELGED